MNKLFAKRVSFSIEFMFARALWDNQPIQQHYILNRASRLFDEGLLINTMEECLEYNLENLKIAHEMQSSGKTIGKIVLEKKN